MDTKLCNAIAGLGGGVVGRVQLRYFQGACMGGWGEKEKDPLLPIPSNSSDKLFLIIIINSLNPM